VTTPPSLTRGYGDHSFLATAAIDAQVFRISADVGFVGLDLEDAFLFKVLEVQALLIGMLKEPNIMGKEPWITPKRDLLALGCQCVWGSRFRV
jgi:hypothetical protein